LSADLILKSMLDQPSAAGRIFAALGDATRRGLVERLSRGPASVSELAEPLDMSLAAVVQHVQILEDCGLVATAKVGRVRTCQLAAGGLDPASRWIADRRALWERRLDRLGDFLAAPPAPSSNIRNPTPPRKKRKP
jgi:DNA-binding transcriptional ArsR family regulator